MGTTLTKRMASAIPDIQAIGHMPVSTVGHLGLALGKALPMTLYGVEAAPASAVQVGKLRTALARMLGEGAGKAS